MSSTTLERDPTFQRAALIAGPVVAGLLLLFVDLDPDRPEVTRGVVAMALALALFIVPARTEPPEEEQDPWGKVWPHGEESTGPSGLPPRVMDWQTAVKLPWGVVLLFGGGFALAAGVKASGLSLWLGGQFGSLSVLHPVLIVLCVCLLLTFLTELTSNTATTELMLPVLAAVAVGSLDVNPLLLMIPATLSCSCAFMLPVATPPNAIVFGSERVSMSDMVRTGVVLNLVGVLLITAAIFVLGGAVLGIDPTSVPAWAE